MFQFDYLVWCMYYFYGLLFLCDNHAAYYVWSTFHRPNLKILNAAGPSYSFVTCAFVDCCILVKLQTFVHTRNKL